MGESCAEHLAIFAALKARDPEGAETLTRKHLMRQLDALHALAEQESEGIAQATADDPPRIGSYRRNPSQNLRKGRYLPPLMPRAPPRQERQPSYRQSLITHSIPSLCFKTQQYI